MRLGADVLKLIDEICAVFEEEKFCEEYASETVRIIRAVAMGHKAIIESNGPLELALKKKFPSNHAIWATVSSETSEFHIKVAAPIDSR